MATYYVTTTADSGDGSLRAAIDDANNRSGKDTIEFKIAQGDRITLTSGVLEIEGALTIEGGGQIINAGGNSQVLTIDSGATVEIESLAITGGSISTRAGAITNSGDLTLYGVTVYGNANGTSAGAGGIFNDRDATLDVLNSTVTGNTGGFAGGIVNNQGVVTVTSSTVSENSGNGVYTYYSSNGQLTLTNSVFAGNKGYDVAGEQSAIYSSGKNLVADGSFTGITVLNVDPELGTLTDNGGLVPTQALAAGSPAIDAGSNLVVPRSVSYDERGPGYSRIIDGDGDGTATVDLGAYEVVQTFTVTTEADSGSGSLRAAIASANTTAGLNFIQFESSVDTVTLSSGELSLTDDVVIVGSGQKIDAKSSSRIFNIATDTDVAIASLTLTGGKTTGDASGGAIYSKGDLVVGYSTLNANTAGGPGGGIYAADGTLDLENVTITGNTASAGGGVGIGSADVYLYNATVANNVGGGVDNKSGTLTLTNSIVALNTTEKDLTSAATGQGVNLIGDGSGTVTGGTTLTGDPKLGDLTNNGGPTDTLALEQNSPAIDAGTNLYVYTAYDQREAGYDRIVNGTVDLGAFEYVASPPPPPPPPDYTYTVNVGGDGSPGPGKYTLRTAIEKAATLDGTVLIDFSAAEVPEGSTIALSANKEQLSIGTATISGQTYTNTNEITIDGSGQTIATGPYGLSVVAKANVDIDDLVIIGASTSASGAGLQNAGTLELDNVTITGGTSAANGGGIYNTGTLTIEQSTISYNKAKDGGAIFNKGSLYLSCSYIYSNSASQSTNAIYNGGDILSIYASTIEDHGEGSYVTI
ncbi:MAG: choice-of-anchor Q domain-containing protein, partial [Actinomycetota bacterium]